MSATKTDALKSRLVAIAMMFVVSPALFFIAFSRTERVSKQTQIEPMTQAMGSTATFFLGIAVMVNAYYTAKRAEAQEKNAIAIERSNQISLRNAEMARSRLIADRFMTAITQLGNENSATRTGAVYSLELVAHQSAKEHWTVMEILTAFVREQSAQIARSEGYSQEGEALRTDIQAALTVIGRRDASLDPQNKLLDLRHITVPYADLRGANFKNLDLRGANLNGADLRGADLCQAELNDSQLVGASLYETNLHKANLRAANLSNANLNRAWICAANLQSANLQGASLRSANLQSANLYKANLQAANLKLANLQGAKLFLANLQGAKLGKANLQGTGLIGANLHGANLNGANLQQVNLNAAKLQYAEAYFANFSHATLKEADLSAANFMGSNFKKADFETANLFQTNLMGANLLDANLSAGSWEGAILTGAKNLKSQSSKMVFGDA